MAGETSRIERELAKIDRLIAEHRPRRGKRATADERTIREALQTRRGALAAQLTGAGAVAQGTGAQAVAPRGVGIGGDASSVTIVTGNVYTGRPTRDPEKALEIYRAVTASALRYLPLRGIHAGASDARSREAPLELARVYVALDTTMSIRAFDSQRTMRADGALVSHEAHRVEHGVTVLEAAAKHGRLVLLGEPGSGKSTFLNHLSLCLASHSSDPRGGWLARLPGWPKRLGSLVPIHVVLRDITRGSRSRWERARADVADVWGIVVAQLKAKNLAFAKGPLERALEDGRTLVLLDGFDETPTFDEQERVRDAVLAFRERYPDNRFIVTCRTLSYEAASAKLDAFQAVRIAPLAPERIDQFVGAWYAELARTGAVERKQASDMARQLTAAVRRSDLWRLAPNPLLLTVMALVHAHEGRLPDARAKLYEKTTCFLLSEWEALKTPGDESAPTVRQLLRHAHREEIDLLGCLSRLAFDAHATGAAADGDSVADISEHALQVALAALHPTGSHDWSRDLIAALKLRAGLLVERLPGVFTFPHRTFQEYLAGAQLSTQPNFATDAARLAGEGAAWRDVILLAVGRLVFVAGDRGRPLELAAELCPEHAVDEDSAWRRAWLAADVLCEVGVVRTQDSQLGRDLTHRVRGRLGHLLRKGRLGAVERAKAGDALARLGDPRFREEAWFLPADATLGFVEVPAGPFTMGSDKKRDKDTQAAETPQHDVTLPAFWIARWPVTVAQFRAYLDSTERKPVYADCLADPANRPVRLVTWHEAMAYCKWLTETLREWSGTPEPLASLLRDGADGRPWCVTLASEAEWEKAARGTDGRTYPWGTELTAEHANYSETGIGATSVVGCFPLGRSPCGAEDMSGNVWEWMRSLWGEDWQKARFRYPYVPSDGREDVSAQDGVLRVVRGGAFYSGPLFLRCAYRLRARPDYRYDDIGFRVVVSPFFSEL